MNSELIAKAFALANSLDAVTAPGPVSACLRDLARSCELLEKERTTLQRAIVSLQKEVGQLKSEPKSEQPAQQQSATAGMNIAQRILHVGGRNNAAGYIEFGSIQAVEALVRQVLRDLPEEQQDQVQKNEVKPWESALLEDHPHSQKEYWPDRLKVKYMSAEIDSLRKIVAVTAALTDEEIMEAVREADLDWQAGWTLDEHEPNRFTTLARAIEAKVTNGAAQPEQPAPERDDWGPGPHEYHSLPAQPEQPTDAARLDWLARNPLAALEIFGGLKTKRDAQDVRIDIDSAIEADHGIKGDA